MFLTLHDIKKKEDRAVQTPYMIRRDVIICVSYNLTLSSTSLRDLPLLWAIMTYNRWISEIAFSKG